MRSLHTRTYPSSPFITHAHTPIRLALSHTRIYIHAHIPTLSPTHPPTHKQTQTEDWFRSLPPVTKCYLVAALLCTLLSHFGLINPYLLLWDWAAIKRFQARVCCFSLHMVVCVCV